MSERDNEHSQDEYDPAADVTEVEERLDGFDEPVVAAEEIDSVDVTDIMPQDDDLSAGEAPEATSEVDETEPDLCLDTDQVDVTEDMGAFAGEQLVGSTGGTDIDATEDMFVVLPDGDEDDIPLVETQEVSFGETDLAEERNTEIFDPDEEETEIGIEEPYGQSAELDHLASELDDELLDDEGEVGFDVDGDEEDVFDDESAFAEEDNSRKKLLLLAAAVLVVSGVSGFLLLREPVPTAEDPVSGGVAVVTPAPTTDPVGTVEPVMVEVPESGSEGSVQVDLVAASEAAFREKFLVAMELGFGGTVDHE